MRTLFACLLLVLLAFSLSWAVPKDDDGQPLLPRGPAPHEVGVPRLPALTVTPPPAEGVRAVAEWEEIEALMVRWPNSVSWNLLWSQFLAPVALDLKIYVLCATTNQSNAARNYFISHNVPIDSMVFVVQSTNSVWIRDYGPWWVWRQSSWDRGIVDWIYNRPRPQDDAVPEWFATANGFPYYGPNLVFTGGNFMVDGWGRGFCSELVFDENGTAVDTIAELDSVMNSFMDLDTVYTFPRFFGIDHIDMSMKLLNDHTAILNQYPPGNAFNVVMDSCEEILTGITNPFGQPVSVTRIATPSWSGNVPYTYTNGIFVNRKVLIPIYNRAEDAAALATWRALLPGYEVFGFDCNSIIASQGAIHCVVKEVSHRSLIRIEYAPLPDFCMHPSQATVRARITSLGTLDSGQVMLYYAVHEEGPWYQTLMTQTSADSFTGTIEPVIANIPVYYYLRAQNVEGNWTTMPRYGPEAHYETRFISAEPMPPHGLSVNSTTTGLELRWDKVGFDVNNVPIGNLTYRIYGSANVDSVVAPANLLLETGENNAKLFERISDLPGKLFFQVTASTP